MIDAKQQAIASIVQARNHLESALSDMEKLPAFDPSTVPFAAHALSNFLSVTEKTVDLLRKSLPSDSSPDVVRLLEGLRHATNLMMHTVSQLINNSSVGELQFRFEKIDLPHMVGRYLLDALALSRLGEPYQPAAPFAIGACRGRRRWPQHPAVSPIHRRRPVVLCLAAL